MQKVADCSRGAGRVPRTADSWQSKVVHLRNKAKVVKSTNAYELLTHPALQPRADVNILLLHITNGVTDLESFSANLSVLCSTLRSASPSSPFLASLRDFHGFQALQHQDTSITEVSKDVEHALRLQCLNSFLLMTSCLKLSLKVLA